MTKTSNERKLSWADSKFLPLIFLLSLVLNIWGNRWGAPHFWHPDEVVSRAISMFGNREINPHHFAYGGLHYYTVWAGAIIPVKIYERFVDPPPAAPQGGDSQDGQAWFEREKARVIQMARTLSALMSMLVVGFTFFIGAKLFDKRAGYLAALFVSVAMAFVAIAHLSTVDAPSNFWYWLSCVFALMIWKRGHLMWYVLAALTAGLAIGVKTDRLMILFPLLLSHFLRRDGLQGRKLLLSAILIPVGFIIANPTFIIAPFEFLDGYTRDLFFNADRGVQGQTSYWRMLAFMQTGLGWPLFVLALLGLGYAFYQLVRRENTHAILWLLTTVAPYFILFGAKSETAPWYLPFFFPALMIFAAQAVIGLMAAMPERYAVFAKTAVAVIVVYSFLNCVALVLQFSNESRYLAGEWIEKNVPANATIQMLARGPVLTPGKYQIANPPPDKEFYDFARGWAENLARDQTYQKIRQAILDLEKWLGRFGLPVREKPYQAWFDLSFAMYEDKPANGLPAADSLQTPEPDYILLIEDLQFNTLKQLKEPGSGYQLAAQFRYVNRLGVQPFFEFVNPPVYVFEREGLKK
jgi:hypothetical protein